jgi:cytochrome c oxidase subunit IV
MERDDIIEYSLDAHHSEEAGRAIRKKIYFVTILLTIITCIEVGLGIVWKSWFPEGWGMVKWTFIVLTLVKATYIVMTFMHLGDERRNIRALILLPYALFILYLIWIAIWESNYIHWLWMNYL